VLLLLLVVAFGCSDDTTSVDVDGGPDSAPPPDSATSDAARDLSIGAEASAPAPDGPNDLAPAPETTAPTGDAAAFPKCTAKGGICTPHRWVLCPVNTEPIHPDPHQDCGQPGAGGWCCVSAPPSTCSAAPGVNCVHGSQCTGCWDTPSDTSLTCEAGRVCCEDICD
jgi:hypothetical protein